MHASGENEEGRGKGKKDTAGNQMKSRLGDATGLSLSFSVSRPPLALFRIPIAMARSPRAWFPYTPFRLRRDSFTRRSSEISYTTEKTSSSSRREVAHHRQTREIFVRLLSFVYFTLIGS